MHTQFRRDSSLLPLPTAATNQESLGKWFAANPFSDASVLRNIDKIIAHLKDDGASKVACEGFCWGGNYALDLAGTDKVSRLAPLAGICE